MWFEVFEGATTIPDTDGDGQPNHLDKDSDNDGWPDGKEDAPLDDFDSDGLLSVIDPDSDNDGLDDGLDMAASFKSKSANAPDPGNGQGGFAGNRVGGGQNVGGNIDCSQTSGEIQDECQDWRKQHPRRFNTYEKELMSGDLTGTSAIADYDCWSWTGCDCEFDSYDRSPSCKDTVVSDLLNYSKSQTTLQQLNWQMEDANQACENIRATGNVNYGFYDYYSNYGCTKPTQYRFEYTAQWDEYVVDCYNLEATENPRRG